MWPVSSSPPLSTVRATFTAHGSAPAVLLHSLRHEAFLRIAPAYTEHAPCPACAFAGDLCAGLSAGEGPSPWGGLPVYTACPVRRLLCPIRLSPGASRIREAFPPHSFPTALPICRGVSRVQHGGLKQHDGGGVFISLPRPRFAAPQSLHRGEDRLTSVTLALPSELACLGPYSHRSSMISGSTG